MVKSTSNKKTKQPQPVVGVSFVQAVKVMFKSADEKVKTRPKRQVQKKK